MVGTCLFSRASTVPNFRLRDVVRRKATELTNIMSIASAMERCVLRISCGTGSIPVRTCCPGRDTVFPFRAPRFGPNMSSTTMTSPLVIEQPFRWVTATSISSLDPGLMMMFWNLLATCARLMARCVYLSALSATLSPRTTYYPHSSRSCNDTTPLR